MSEGVSKSGKKAAKEELSDLDSDDEVRLLNIMADNMPSWASPKASPTKIPSAAGSARKPTTPAAATSSKTSETVLSPSTGKRALSFSASGSQPHAEEVKADADPSSSTSKAEGGASKIKFSR